MSKRREAGRFKGDRIRKADPFGDSRSQWPWPVHIGFATVPIYRLLIGKRLCPLTNSGTRSDLSTLDPTLEPQSTGTTRCEGAQVTGFATVLAPTHQSDTLATSHIGVCNSSRRKAGSTAGLPTNLSTRPYTHTHPHRSSLS
jgi:hypothetical protein